MNNQFKREVRYNVIKLKTGMPVNCVVVEEDWPEYEIVWQMIQDRVEGKPNEWGALKQQLAEANNKLVEAEQRGYDRCVVFHNSIVGALDGSEVDLLAKAKEKGRAESQARIKVLEDALREIASFTQSTNLMWWQTLAREALSTTSPTEALDNVVAKATAEAKEDMRERCAKVCEAEFVGESLYADIRNEGDQAYNTALQHCAEAIRRIEP